MGENDQVGMTGRRMGKGLRLLLLVERFERYGWVRGFGVSSLSLRMAARTNNGKGNDNSNSNSNSNNSNSNNKSRSLRG
jgi:hypothetical protein